MSASRLVVEYDDERGHEFNICSFGMGQDGVEGAYIVSVMQNGWLSVWEENLFILSMGFGQPSRSPPLQVAFHGGPLQPLPSFTGVPFLGKALGCYFTTGQVGLWVDLSRIARCCAGEPQ